MSFEELVTWVSDDVDAFWAEAFAAADLDYESSEVSFVEGTTETGCGSVDMNEAGPNYCTSDGIIRIPPAFFAQLDVVRPDFATAYVVAHEYGHHVQRELGLYGALETGAVDGSQFELQADCISGLWAASTYRRQLLEEGDIEEAALAAWAGGSDLTGRPPEEWTHGSSEQRVTFFMRGFTSGDPGQCAFGVDEDGETPATPSPDSGPTDSPPPDLAASLPAEAGGEELGQVILSGEELVGDESFEAERWQAFLDALGAEPASLTAAFGISQTEPAILVGAVQVVGADEGALLDAFRAYVVYQQVAQIGFEAQELGGKTVQSVEPNGALWFYATGDILYLVSTPDEALAAEALAQMP